MKNRYIYLLWGSDSDFPPSDWIVGAYSSKKKAEAEKKLREEKNDDGMVSFGIKTIKIE